MHISPNNSTLHKYRHPRTDIRIYKRKVIDTQLNFIHSLRSLYNYFLTRLIGGCNGLTTTNVTIRTKPMPKETLPLNARNEKKKREIPLILFNLSRSLFIVRKKSARNETKSKRDHRTRGHLRNNLTL